MDLDDVYDYCYRRPTRPSPQSLSSLYDVIPDLYGHDLGLRPNIRRSCYDYDGCHCGDPYVEKRRRVPPSEYLRELVRNALPPSFGASFANANDDAASATVAASTSTSSTSSTISTTSSAAAPETTAPNQRESTSQAQAAEGAQGTEAPPVAVPSTTAAAGSLAEKGAEQTPIQSPEQSQEQTKEKSDSRWEDDLVLAEALRFSLTDPPSQPGDVSAATVTSDETSDQRQSERCGSDGLHHCTLPGKCGGPWPGKFAGTLETAVLDESFYRSLFERAEFADTKTKALRLADRCDDSRLVPWMAVEFAAKDGGDLVTLSYVLSNGTPGASAGFPVDDAATSLPSLEEMVAELEENDRILCVFVRNRNLLFACFS